ncbi:MAG: hypothetical protein ACXV5J_05750 [Candidatus Angelobacter sp.]
MKRARFILPWLLLPAVILLKGQRLPAQSSDQNSAAGPSIAFTRVWNDFTPQSVTITVSANGAAKYSSRNPEKTGDDVDDYQTEFSVSPACRDKLFRYAREAHYFDGDFTFKKHAVASTGKKTLSYSDPARHFNTSYDYSENKAIEEITNILSGISNTIEHGRKLVFLRRFDKLGLEEELKAMEDAAAGHNLAELQIIAPTLESIAGDRTVLNIARQRAQKLLTKANSE